jgi:dolichyl-phosphate beta-glucosyltransferase
LDSLSIVIPAYNEANRLPATLERVLAWLETARPDCREVIVVDDGSSDETALIVQRCAESHSVIRLLRNPGNRGKGYAVRNGMLEARGEWILYTDADLSSPIEEFEKLRAAARAADASVAIGSRAIDRSLVAVHQPILREYSGRFYNLAMRVVAGLPFADTQCGFKLYRADAARDIFSRQKLDGFSFDVEDLYIAKKLRHRVVEVPVRWANVDGTKVSLLSGLKAFPDLWKIRRLHR